MKTDLERVEWWRKRIADKPPEWRNEYSGQLAHVLEGLDKIEALAKDGQPVSNELWGILTWLEIITNRPIKVPQTQVQAAVSNYFRGELLNQAEDAEKQQAGQGWRYGGLAFLRAALKETVLDIFGSSGNGDKLIRQAIRDEINRMLAGRVTGRGNILQAMVSDMVREEVRALVVEQVKAKLKVSLEVDVDPDRYVEGAKF